MDFEFENRPYLFIDMETGEQLRLQPNQVKDHYVSQIKKFKEKYGDWEKLAMVKRYDSGIDDITLRNLQKRISVQLDENGEPVFTPELKSQINQVKKNAERNGEITFVSTNERVAYISVIVILGILLVYQYQKQ